MPELPEVETIVKTLETSLLHETIAMVDFRYVALLEAHSDYPLESLIGQTFVSFKRRGKYLCFGFSNDTTWVLHLRMEGKFNLYDHPIEPTKHTHLVMVTNHHHIHYLDTRKFSRMAVLDNAKLDAYFIAKKLGLEPWDSTFDAAFLFQALMRRTQGIKTALLAQDIVVGIGNIYADEILFDTMIHPKTACNKLSLNDAENLVVAIRNNLEHAIRAGGTTIRSYTSGLNVTGRFQIELKAYGRYGEACLRCDYPLDKIKISGRTSVFCPRCQKVIV